MRGIARWMWLCLLGCWLAGGELLDRDSFLARGDAGETRPGSAAYYRPKSEERSSELIDRKSFLARPSLVLKMKRRRETLQEEAGIDIQNEVFQEAMRALSLHLYQDAIQLLQRLVQSSPRNSDYYFNLGCAYQGAGDISNAIKSYERSFQLHPEEKRALLNYGVLVQGMGDFDLAARTYRRVLNLLDKLKTNDDISMYSKVASNLGASYFQAARTTEANQVFSDLLDLLWHLMELNCRSVNISQNESELLWNACLEMQLNYDQALNYLTNIAHSLAVFKEREVSVSYLLRRTLLGTEASREVLLRGALITDPAARLMYFEIEEGTGPLLPFDSLINEISLPHRLYIARAASNYLLRSISMNSSSFKRKPSIQNPKMKIAFITCDFNDHPTAHLVEGIFAIVKQQRDILSRGRKLNFDNNNIVGIFQAELIAFSYGVSVNSIFREKIMELADKFIDLSELSNSEASDLIRRENVDILLDMQIHTLGHRLQITAAQPAPVQMNYLVYPGTSGSSFLQYLVADRVVAPAEHSLHYSESLLMMPSTYQISFYDRYMKKFPPVADFHKLDKRGGSTRVLCNLNKIDKFDSESFTVWSNIMNRYPSSVMKLVLDSRMEAEENLINEFAMRGVHKGRVGFLSRLPKEEHIRRHSDIDLFVDSFVYGAHSTATDAMMGGLPVLTLTGESFPQRVASSLLSSLHNSKNKTTTARKNSNPDSLHGSSVGLQESFNHLTDMLQTFSKKSFEDVGVRLLQSPIILKELRKQLLQASGSIIMKDKSKSGFFDTERMVQEFLRGMHAAKEMESSFISASQNSVSKRRKFPHIIVANE